MEYIFQVNDRMEDEKQIEYNNDYSIGSIAYDNNYLDQVNGNKNNKQNVNIENNQDSSEITYFNKISICFNSYTKLDKIIPEDVGFSTLNDIIGYEEVPYKFKSKAKIINIMPKDFRDMVRLFCHSCQRALDGKFGDDYQCDKCGESQNCRYTYIFKLYLKDSSTSKDLQVIIYDKNGEYFLNMTPTQFLTNKNNSRLQIEKKLNELIEKDIEIDLCIMSYYINSPSERLYQMFGTKLILLNLSC